MIAASNSLDLVSVKLIRDKTIAYGEMIRTPQDLHETVSPLLEDMDREVFAVINLNSKHQPINLNIVSMGGINKAYVDAREVFKASILSNAVDLCLIHNHPSGDASPSLEDERLTERLMEGAALLGFNVLDHIIISPNHKYYSFAENGLMEKIKDNVESRRLMITKRTDKYYQDKASQAVKKTKSEFEF